MPRSDSSSDYFSKFRSESGIGKTKERPQQFACDRCRGQKLRCIRSADSNAPCERCQKARATCIVDSSVRMGRPKRTDKELREAGHISRIPSQSTHSSSSPPSSHSSSRPFWFEHDQMDEAVDPSLTGAQYHECFDFGVSNAILDDDVLNCSPSEDCLGSFADFATTPFLSNADTTGTNNTATEMSGLEGMSHTYTNNRPGPTLSESIQKVSCLNLELNRQLGITGPMANKYTNEDPCLGESMDKNKCLSGTIVFMIQGLQTFHELLLGILGYSNQDFCKEATARRSVHSSHDNQPRGMIQNGKLSPTGGRDHDRRHSMSEASSWKPPGGFRSDSSAEPQMQQGSSQITFLDVPTSLLTISCYINLVQLCRDIFATIRAALPPPGHQTTLFTSSDFQISGVSIHQDSDLQIIVLTQAVVRLLDRIEHALGHPYSCGAKSEPFAKAISPQLLDFVLRQDGIGRHPSHKVGIEALREEIRRLNELVYKPV